MARKQTSSLLLQRAYISKTPNLETIGCRPACFRTYGDKGLDKDPSFVKDSTAWTGPRLESKRWSC